ncbi:MAG: bifunctional riboflavin kinase/FAD synthetase [Corynebacterium sp.]|uniref:bifunctional riboflavin kinase/FAD synthetase n=1 Tax=Corynebacterium sp. TaxID=1720 RepID=UPI0026DCBD84|nr:bifunctional riboflavin kinase/FAD synthetase [Corynebacterium sp.]MDO5098023.1 bifunctional riboflavin kinase/FAD synthetase [Corynebacterium sp.]
MDIWRGFNDVPENLGKTVVTIGVFDGMHRGHKTLLAAATSRAQELKLATILLTFDPHPLAVLRPDKMPPLLGTVTHRAELAAAEGIDHMLAMTFNAAMAQLSPEEFFTTILLDTLNAQVVVVGENFTFGHNAAGTTETLAELGKKHGVEIHVQRLLIDDGATVCSTLIRQLLAEGKVAEANWALGRTFKVRGEVVRGAGRGGKELGFPTANLYFPESVALPKDGVYAGWFRIVSDAPVDGDMQQGIDYAAAISVGHNPTFGDARRSVESYVIGRNADLYGHTVEVEFVDYIRGMEKFSNVDELLDAIRNDITLVHKALETEEMENP